MKPTYTVTYTPIAGAPSICKFNNYNQAMHQFDILKLCTLIEYVYVTKIDDISIEVIDYYTKED